MNNVKLLHRKWCFSQFFNSPVALKNKKNFRPPKKKLKWRPWWPPEAAPWINRHRPSNWPTRETVERIISMGCSVVPKPHPLNRRTTNIEFRFSFSNAEKILFQEMSLAQKHCFISFKALVKSATEEIEGCQEGTEMVISTYHLKTIFLWTCETIDTTEWEMSRGWAHCLLFLFDQWIICLEHKSIPSFFIPQCNLLEGKEAIKLANLIIIIIIWFGDTVTVSHPTKCNTYSKVRALSWVR